MIQFCYVHPASYLYDLILSIITTENDFLFFQSWKLPFELLMYLDLIVCHWNWTWNFRSLLDKDTSIPVRKLISKCNSDLDMYLHLSTSDWRVCKLKQTPTLFSKHHLYEMQKYSYMIHLHSSLASSIQSSPSCMNVCVCVHLFPHVPHIYLYAITFSLMKRENDFVFVVRKSIIKNVTT